MALKKAGGGLAEASAAVEHEIRPEVHVERVKLDGGKKVRRGERYVGLHVEVPETIRQQLRIEAATKGVTIQRILMDMLQARYMR